MNPRPTKQELRAYLKALCRSLTFDRDQHQCIRCRKRLKLCCAHVYPKGKYRALEFDLDNLMTLCYACHMHWWHKHPVDAADWFRAMYPERAERVLLRSMMISKVDLAGLRVALELEAIRRQIPLPSIKRKRGAKLGGRKSVASRAKVKSGAGLAPGNRRRTASRKESDLPGPP